ncbi:hypothetical protein DFA_00942 [Cavenderia fasciculata]|uniref:Uncharacterized protein n=1 Tax=Cavenderia fasciculata TaxID=261658 RepID=F4PUQ0_CACFS|nr:uncharacterized protein DFA_00942 [Cavenderia fasciculata]EGG21069.1 hypothetical protein DFA_00942 [Cavenderia fasciculata]|eukprot:XP_004358919.1 hypothetical protein DFA_00942 [Cavenderia fasciculata]
MNYSSLINNDQFSRSTTRLNLQNITRTFVDIDNVSFLTSATSSQSSSQSYLSYCTTNSSSQQSSSSSSSSSQPNIQTPKNQVGATTQTKPEMPKLESRGAPIAINSEWMEHKLAKPLMSRRTGNILFTVTCTISTYLCLIMDYGDADTETAATPIKEFHDRILSEWLGYPVRPIIYKWEMAVRDLFNAKSIEDKLSPGQLERYKNSGEFEKRKSDPFTMPERKKKKKETPDEKVDREIRETKEDIIAMEKMFNDYIKTKWLEKNIPNYNSDSNNDNKN